MAGRRLRDREADIAEDEDNPEWTESDFKRARPASEVLGPDAAAALVRVRGRPAKAPEERKRQVTLRLSPDLLEEMRSSGAGWQARAEAILRREFIDAEVEAVAAAMRSALEGGSMVDIHFDEQVRRGFEQHSALVVRHAIEKLKAENFKPKRRDLKESRTLFERMSDIARTAAKTQSGRLVVRSSQSGRMVSRSLSTKSRTKRDGGKKRP